MYPMKKCRLFAWLVVAAASSAACTKDPATAEDAGDDGADTVVCIPDGSPYHPLTYAAGLSMPGQHGALSFDLLRADPAPPAQGLNTFTLKVTHMDGTPFTGQLEFAPNGRGVFMPIHMHPPSAPIPMISFDPAQGTFDLTLMNFFMSGLWQVEVYAFDNPGDGDGGADSEDASSGNASTGSGAPTDIGLFYFCID